MYAVIKTGGKQYKVAEGDVLRVEKLTADAGEIVSFDQILMLSDDQGTTVGTPHVVGAEVKATVLEQARDDKIMRLSRGPCRQINVNGKRTRIRLF